MTALLFGAAATLGATGGIAIGNGGGGLGAPTPPTVSDVRCLDHCLDIRTVAQGGRAEVVGRSLETVETVKLAGADGRVSVRPRSVSAERVVFVVPDAAQTGKPVVVDAFGNKARAAEDLVVKPAGAVEDAGDFRVKRAEAAPTKSFFDAKQRSALSYLFEASKPTDVRIDVLKGKKRKLVTSIVQRDRKPFSNNRATWNGLRKNGKVAANGKYKFKVQPLSGGRGSGAGFEYYDHIFPLRAKHSFGDGLGAGRNHQGVDIFGRCGAPVVAARGGRVKTRAYHGSAGYYLVIDGRKTGVDYAYMHLEKRGRAKLGSKVRTGQRIAYNSDTGNASGCHLHFEMWSAPGWYSGGSPMDPVPHVKRWDRWS
jgi:murein DD-endopeptidase MepM/ murein hydrolase activator NlpD